MKKSILTILTVSAAFLLNAQTVLNFNTHALKAEKHNPMSYCEYMMPGASGNDITWDFNDLVFKKSFTGFLNDIALTKNSSAFKSSSNTELAEFNSRFYFDVAETGIKQYGYASADGKSQIIYNVPFEKIRYPFSYQDAYSGNYNGTYNYLGKQRGIINGNYLVEADAYGTLILPGNKIYENTLRIRTEKSYSNKLSNSTQEVSITTYRWYNSSHTYPLLVLTEYTTKSGNTVSTKHQAAYNNYAVDHIVAISSESLELYPNPVINNLYITVETNLPGLLKFSIYDASGRLVQSFQRDINQSGKTELDLTNEISDFQPGSYTLVVDNGTNRINKSFAVTK